MWSFFSRDPVKDFAYDIGEKINGFDDKSIWQLYKGKKKGTLEPVSIFLFEMKPGTESWLETAKASVKCLKTLRHPNILTYVDSLETDKLIYLVTEYVESLEMHLANSSMTNDQKKLAISWGLYQITKGLCFLNNDCNLLHNYLCMSSVFVDRAGEWRLGGLDYVCSANQRSPSKLLISQEIYNPPEVKNPSFNKDIPKWSADSWGLGCLIWEAFNGPLTKPADLKCVKKLPNNIASLYCELVSANPSSRLNPSSFLNKCCIKGGFMKNKFVDTMLFLEEIQIKDSNEMNRFLNVLVTLLDTFPQEICKYKILNQLLNAFEFGNAGSAVLVPLFKLAKSLDDTEYQQRIVPCIVKLFTCKDRATRARLLQQMDQFIHHIQPTVVNDQIFPQVAQGFMDTNPTIREQTIKCMLHMAPKLNYYNLNEEVLKHFARLQARDSQGGIRTNTTVCLGKIAIYLHPQTRQKVLVPAFIRAMRDPFPPARTAGILAVAATQGFYTLNDCAIKVLPALCQLVVDPDKSVRDQAFKAIKGFLNKLEKVSEDPSLLEQMEEEVNSEQTVSSSASAMKWAGWAVSSLTSKFYRSYSPPKTVSNNQNEKLDNKIQSETSNDQTKPNIDTSDTPSDYEDAWNETEWGNIDSEPNINKSFSIENDQLEGWECDEWDSFEIKTEESSFKTEISVKSDEEGRTKELKDYFSNDDNSWESWSQEPIKTINNNAKNEELKRKKEERRLQREKAMQERQKKRQSSSGPMKLGAQKVS